MNLYFLLEGRRTEKKVYPKLLERWLPKLQRVQFHIDAKEDNYYLISYEGFPNIFRKGLPNAIKEIEENDNFDYLILVVDTDNNSEVFEYIEKAKKETQLKNCQFHIVTQTVCIESWFLGNRAIYPNIEKIEGDFLTHHQFYDVSQKDPELMLKPDNYAGITVANYHEIHLKKILSFHGLSYSKNHPGRVTATEYIAELESRINETPHLSSLRNFFNFCESLSI